MGFVSSNNIFCTYDLHHQGISALPNCWRIYPQIIVNQGNFLTPITLMENNGVESLSDISKVTH